MKTSELLKLLKENGCELVAHRKKHDEYYSRRTGISFCVPRHKKEIAVGTVNSILKDAGLK